MLLCEEKQSHMTKVLFEACGSMNEPLPPLTSSRISLLRVNSSGRSLISFSMLCSPPCSTIDLDFSAMDCGIESPDRSSRAAGRFRDANTLTEYKIICQLLTPQQLLKTLIINRAIICLLYTNTLWFKCNTVWSIFWLDERLHTVEHSKYHGLLWTGGLLLMF